MKSEVITLSNNPNIQLTVSQTGNSINIRCYDSNKTVEQNQLLQAYLHLILLDALSTRLGQKQDLENSTTITNARLRTKKIKLDTDSDNNCTGYQIAPKHKTLFARPVTLKILAENSEFEASLHNYSTDQASIKELANYLNTKMQSFSGEDKQKLEKKINEVQEYNRTSTAQLPLSLGVIALCTAGEAITSNVSIEEGSSDNQTIHREDSASTIDTLESEQDTNGLVSFKSILSKQAEAEEKEIAETKARARKNTEEAIQRATSPQPTDTNAVLQALDNKMRNANPDKTLRDILSATQAHYKALEKARNNHEALKTKLENPAENLSTISKLWLKAKVSMNSLSRDQQTKLVLLDLIQQKLTNMISDEQFGCDFKKVATDIIDEQLSSSVQDSRLREQGRSKNGAMKALLGSSWSSYFSGHQSLQAQVKKIMLENSNKGTLHSLKPGAAAGAA